MGSLRRGDGDMSMAMAGIVRNPCDARLDRGKRTKSQFVSLHQISLYRLSNKREQLLFS